jgi:uncharacterized membrane protein
MPNRIAIIDQARGIAVIGMVIFNYAFALTFLGKANFPVYDGAFWWLARIVAFTFIFISGISISISYDRIRDKYSPRKILEKYFYRGARIFGIGLAISAITWLYNPAFAIWFGILHLIGLSVLLSIPILKWQKKWILVVGSICVLIGIFIRNIQIGTTLFFWLGFWPRNWSTFDYFPLFPWFGFFLIGMVFGKAFFDADKRKGGKISNPILKLSAFLGRHSLAIYLFHQPILLLAIKISGI